MARTTKAGNQGPAPLPLWRLLAVSAVALTTANCAQNTQKLAGATAGGSGRDPKYGVKASPRLYNEGDVIPKGGGRRFSGKPYVVAGRTYVPREDAKGYVREGLASWYGAAFHGRLTANGEVFDRLSIAAAHPTLPLPSYARVTNLANGHSMIVRVNDRGPYHANRLMDVSEEVAEALEFRRSGTARVRVEYAGKASTAGSDDRKLLATLRTDGRPAALRGQAPVMVADLGPSDAPQVPSERLARANRSALAFREAGERDTADVGSGEVPETALAPVRPAPVLVASAATVAVPAALQPTAVRAEAFRPVRHSPSETHPAVAQVAPRPAPLSLTPPPLRLAGARPDPARPETKGRLAAAPSVVPAARSVAPLHAVAKPGAKPVAMPAPTRLAGMAPAAPASKAVLARLAAEAAGPKAGVPKSGAAQFASIKESAPTKDFTPTKGSLTAKGAASAKPVLAAKASSVEKPGPVAKPALVAKGAPRGRAQFAEAR